MSVESGILHSYIRPVQKTTKVVKGLTEDRGVLSGPKYDTSQRV